MEGIERPHVISCGILRKEIEHIQEKGDIDVAVHFLSEKLHMDYRFLHQGLNSALKKHQKACRQRAIVVYGDVCLGFNGEMDALINKYDAVKIDALNCIDCLLGGKGKLLEIDPDHKHLFLNPAFIQFIEKIRGKTKEETRKIYSMLDGIVLLDTMGDLNTYRPRIDEIADHTGLPILDNKKIGLEGLKKLFNEAVAQYREKCFVNK